ncbi:MMPL family transporter [Streptomyces sp. NPDC046237]|uniref:MMPL family transporter n=1 Tax=Streptomyces sp. NPDC046237 TaxID=3154914 RepID=UPI0033F9FD27
MALRTFTAALLPVLVGAASVVLRLAFLRLVCAITPVSAFALNLTIALGSGLAVDYSVFLLSRYRDERAAGAVWEAALAAARRATSRPIAYSRLPTSDGVPKVVATRLAAVVDEVAPRAHPRVVRAANGRGRRWDGDAGVGEARGRQLWMLVGMFDRAVGQEEMPDRAVRTAGAARVRGAGRGALQGSPDLRRYICRRVAAWGALFLGWGAVKRLVMSVLVMGSLAVSCTSSHEEARVRVAEACADYDESLDPGSSSTRRAKDEELRNVTEEVALAARQDSRWDRLTTAMRDEQKLREQAAIFADNERSQAEWDAAEAEMARLDPARIRIAIDQECRKATA